MFYSLMDVWAGLKDFEASENGCELRIQHSIGSPVLNRVNGSDFV